MMPPKIMYFILSCLEKEPNNYKKFFPEIPKEDISNSVFYFCIRDMENLWKKEGSPTFKRVYVKALK